MSARRGSLKGKVKKLAEKQKPKEKKSPPKANVDRERLCEKLGLAGRQKTDPKIIYTLSRLARGNPRTWKGMGLTPAEFAAYGIGTK